MGYGCPFSNFTINLKISITRLKNYVPQMGKLRMIGASDRDPSKAQKDQI